ncbi:PadR family transcriptional regulator [Martelella endophytica]|uniref:PadR family transcriptional regulator n=1 Tax=Martelella endophytica TaxID=1486262 RepID=UPI0005F26B9E|nr:PadR family transcriptional regulator [Martelella endophytica]
MRGRFEHFDMREFLAMGRGPGHRHGRGGPGGRGFGDDDGNGRIGRFLGQGRIRVLVLQLISEEPRHGYEIIKAIEEMSGGFYSPSPGVIYPTLSYLEEGGYVVAESEGNKKRYSITEEGKTYLDEQEPEAAMAVKALQMVAERLKFRQKKWDRARGGGNLPKSVEAAFLNLREVVDRKLEEDEAAAGTIVRALLDFAEKLEDDDLPSGFAPPRES